MVVGSRHVDSVPVARVLLHRRFKKPGGNLDPSVPNGAGHVIVLASSIASGVLLRASRSTRRVALLIAQHSFRASQRSVAHETMLLPGDLDDRSCPKSNQRGADICPSSAHFRYAAGPV
ncbi:hypothetical protein RHA1_ro08970 (plasmid) [Rhodococcus jostii RHA1]|uniref:Uncharacterized protein n=1 Tax=Rhodococcus jostii (strain RHA1) TaxID=101510 RepID=Q0RXH2_RHOJR|nr:hypothetical protein RHA1_ro08970 [Rhodococcus jostii RHA1]